MSRHKDITPDSLIGRALTALDGAWGSEVTVKEVRSDRVRQLRETRELLAQRVPTPVETLVNATVMVSLHESAIAALDQQLVPLEAAQAANQAHVHHLLEERRDLLVYLQGRGPAIEVLGKVLKGEAARARYQELTGQTEIPRYVTPARPRRSGPTLSDVAFGRFMDTHWGAGVPTGGH